MSRTYRRVEMHTEINLVPGGLIVEDGILKQYSIWSHQFFAVTQKYKTCSPEQYLKRVNAHFHSDSQKDWNAPAWFRRTLGRAYRSKMNQRLKKALIDGVEDAVVMDRFVKNANWEWW